MKHLSIPLFTFVLHLSASAALPIHLDVELTAQPPQVFTLQRPRGETYELEADLKRHGKPFAPAITNACIYWQTNGMENLYWSAPASVSNNVLRATWLPSMDPGAATVRGYIGDPGHIYAAAFQFRFIASPGELPNALPLPTPVIDFAKVTVLNPPWSGGGSGGVDTNAVRDIARPMIATATNDLAKTLADSTNDLARTLGDSIAAAIPPAISNAECRVDADLTVRQTVTYADWTPSHNEKSDTPQEEDRYVFNIGYNPYYGCWEAEQEIYLDGMWKPFTNLSWDSTIGPDATELTFPDGTKTYRKRTVTTRLATTIDLSAKLDGPADHTLTLTGKAADAKATGDAISSAREEADAAVSAANDANAWSSAMYAFMSGGRTNCWFAGTNYVFGADAAARTRFAWEDGMDAATVPCSMALWEIRDGVRQLVWDQRDWPTWYWSFKAHQMQTNVTAQIAALGRAVTNAENYAWSKRYASDGTPNPDASTTFIDTPSVTLSPGMKWETVATVSGAAYWTIVGNGAVIGGTGTNAVLRIQDFEGNDIMTVTKGEHRLAWLESGEITGQMTDGNGWICFDMLTDAEPVGYFSTTLDSSDFLPQTDPNCPAQYSWENIGGGKWRVHYLLKPGIQANACFAKFQVEVEGKTVIRYNAGQEISGGLIYNGVNIAPDISGTPAVGTVIQWKVVR